MPDGTSIGYLFTDIDGSTERWERAPVQMERAVARHDGILDVLIARHGGAIRDRAGDGVFAVFEDGDPLGCALAVQLALQREEWSSVGGLRLRIGVHAGSNEGNRPIDQVSINRAARMTGSAWPGQIVVSAEAVSAFETPAGSRIDDLGFCQLRGIDRPLRLYSLVHADFDRTEFPPLRSLASFSRPFADQHAPFFGRQGEVEQIKAMLASPHVRLLTMVGPGGNGKTRLAAYIASESAETAPVWFISLDGVSDDVEMAAAIGYSMRFPFYGTAPHQEQLLQYLRDKQGLLVLDNAEGLGRDTHLIGRLERECMGLGILATSRRPLGIPGETLFHVDGFEAPGGDAGQLRTSPAYQLFRYQASAAQPGFELDDSEFDAFRDLCAMLDGSPLAILLAAQWRHLLSLEDIVARIRDDLDFLQAAQPIDLARHRSVRTVFEGTWALLSDEQQLALARLSVFHGGFEAAAAESVARLSLLTLAELTDRGLIDQKGNERCAMHPLVRDYASQKLAALSDEDFETRSLHARHFLSMVRKQYQEVASRGQAAVLDHVESEIANLMAAWQFANQFEPEMANEDVTEALFYCLVLRARYNDAVKFFGALQPPNPHHLSLLANCQLQLGDLEATAAAATAALQNGRATPTARAHALHALGLVAHANGDIAEAKELYHQALDIRRGQSDSMGCYFSLASLGVLHLAFAELAEARVCIKESHLISQKMGNTSGMMIVHFLAGEVAAQERRIDDAKENYRQSLKIEEALHHPQHRSRILISLGALLATQGQSGEALDCHQQALDLAREVGDQQRAAGALLELGVDLRLDGRLDQARVRLIEAIRLVLELSTPPLLMRCLFELARVEVKAGATSRAQRLSAILAAGKLGPLQKAYDALACELPATPLAAAGITPEAVARQIVDEADLSSLRL